MRPGDAVGLDECPIDNGKVHVQYREGTERGVELGLNSVSARPHWTRIDASQLHTSKSKAM